jgi:DNA polymerase epsilon subunit 2
MEKLRILFAGYAEFPPTCFILCGNFLSSHQGSQHVKILKGKNYVNIKILKK